MRSSITCVVCSVLAVAFVQTSSAGPIAEAVPVHNISLRAPRDIADAAAVNSAITVMLNDVASCSPAAAQDPRSCACGFTNDLKKLRQAYNTAVAKHPDWNAMNNLVTYVDAVNGKSVAINFPGIKRQLDTCTNRKM